MANADGMSQLMSDKLDKNNFHAWRFRMTNFLMGKGYWKYIEGENKNALQLPERNRTANQLRAYEEWNQGARKIMYWLSVSIQDSMIGHIQYAKTPKEAWKSLGLKIKSICESLASIGVNVDDNDKVEVCLHGLGVAYK
ncbi:hypothetical protein KP509_15G060000 [Ceratopteris richardii]|uniref:Retrotransposon Copia-like N-terminal domain-containing protein n=1 Tax=Ceratopteris richardii TaxID=49495 RepID=A0A8T2T642_CERRI|nr:hypothetical protein KP509_15G060000 [Ceratopteris richardii]